MAGVNEDRTLAKTKRSARASRPLFILEGCDGAGKSTLAQHLVATFKAKYVHHGSYKGVTQGLGKVYAESMLPAVLGKQAVVLDRSWLSEAIYAKAFRNGQDRLGAVGVRLLNRLALRCRVIVVRCQPPFNVIQRNLAINHKDEHHGDLTAIRQVYQGYQEADFGLPTIDYDFTAEYDRELFYYELKNGGTVPHQAGWRTAGSLLGKVALVGEAFASPSEHDPAYQWPFSSFSDSGCSQWLTRQLVQAKVPEQSLFWVNADHPQLDDVLQTLIAYNPDIYLVTLGAKADRQLRGLGLHAAQAPHPQYWKRFHHHDQYPLLPLLQRLGR